MGDGPLMQVAANGGTEWVEDGQLIQGDADEMLTWTESVEVLKVAVDIMQ